MFSAGSSLTCASELSSSASRRSAGTSAPPKRWRPHSAIGCSGVFCKSCEQLHSTQVCGVSPQPGMKFLDQAGFAEPRLADDQHQLAVALPRPLPAPHQHRHFVVAADERREIARAGAAPAAARADEPEQSHRLGHALERVRAALFGDEQPGDLALHPRGDQNRARLGQRLHPRRDIGDVAENLARRIHHRGTGFEADAGDKLRLAGDRVLAVEFGERALDRKRRPRRALGIVLLRDRIAEQRHQPVAELLGDMAAHLRHRRRSGIEISADQVAPLLGIELRGNAGRADEIAEHHREIAAFARGFGRWGERRRRHRSRDRRRNDGRCRRGCRHRRSCPLQRGDRPQNLAPVAERGNADLFQVLIGQIGKDREIDIVLGETRRVLTEPKTGQPLFDRRHCNPHPLTQGA